MRDANVVAIVQARMGSERFPGKVLADIHGKPMLIRVVERAARADSLISVLVATSTEAQDDAIEQACLARGIRVFRGDPLDVLDRTYQAAREAQADVIVRVTGDCPLIDPALIDEAVQAFVTADPPVDFVANRLPDQRTYPIGTDVEVCSFAALERAWKEAILPPQREHVTSYLYEEPDRFRTQLLRHDLDLSHFRWTVDEEPDLEFVRVVYSKFDPDKHFTWLEVVALLESEPSLAEINAAVPQRGLV